MPGIGRRNFAGGGAGVGPEAKKRDSSDNRQVVKPRPPKNLPKCTSKEDSGLNPKTHTASCHLSMSRDSFTMVEDPDMLWARSFMVEGEMFHAVWLCETCGRHWLRYTRKSGWGKREFRWTHIWKVTEEE